MNLMTESGYQLGSLTWNCELPSQSLWPVMPTLKSNNFQRSLTDTVLIMSYLEPCGAVDKSKSCSQNSWLEMGMNQTGNSSSGVWRLWCHVKSRYPPPSGTNWKPNCGLICLSCWFIASHKPQTTMKHHYQGCVHLYSWPAFDPTKCRWPAQGWVLLRSVNEVPNLLGVGMGTICSLHN